MAFAGFEKVFRRFAIEPPSVKGTEPSPKNEKTFVRYFEAGRDKKGNKAFIAHKSVATETELKPAGEVKEETNNECSKEDEVKEFNADDKKSENIKRFTPEEDARLRAFKATNTSWKKIATEMNRPIGQLKTHWHKLEKQANATIAEVAKEEKAKNKNEGKKAENTKDKANQGGKSGEPNWKNMTLSERKAEGLRRKAEKELAKAGNNAPKKEESKETSKSKQETAAIVEASGSSDEVRFTMQEWLTLQEDDMFSFGEIKCISDIMAKSPDQTWDRIASKFFDRTGRRVHPLDIRDKFLGLAELQKEQA